MIQETGRFTVNVLAIGQHALADRFTQHRPFGAEEFAGVLCAIGRPLTAEGRNWNKAPPS
ncbi:hypothetical protein [Streptomyces sp. MMS24-I29]|uniref:hypothetical protein n=1 Tax=Streptomyces sp. MMS24-I29 TaxID=3351480 RepID=UPI003C7C92CC